jgi:nicotinate-nucleotide adenylyltransferase
MDQRRRIAIYGGTFDPVHSGHVEIARKVFQLFAIDEFLFVPARRAPHKKDREVSSSFDRYAMLALALQNETRLLLSRFELERPETQYTVDTLLHFRSRYGEFADLFFVMGADSWAEIHTWRDWQRLTTLASLIVVTRPGFEIASETLEVGPMVDVRGLSTEKVSDLVQSGRRQVFITDAVMMDIAATDIRRAASAKSDLELEKLVPPPVAEYIRKYGLYRNTNEA